MSVAYVGHGATIQLAGEGLDGSGLVLDPSMERGAAAIGEQLREPIKKHPADFMVIRGSTFDFAELLEGDPILPDLARKAEIPVFGLAGSHQADSPDPQLWQPDWAIPGHAPGLRALRALELEALLRRREAIYALKGFHYILPSRSHAARFIRLADAISDPIETVRLVDWLLPFVRPDSSVVADTGTLLPLLFALQSEARARFGYDLRLANLSEYPTDYVAMDGLLSELASQGGSHSLLLVSVSSTGQVAERFEELSKGDHDVVVLCDTGNGSSESFCRYPITRWQVGAHTKCDRCDDLHELVIDPRTYQVLPVEGLIPIPFDRKVAARQAEFWELADRTEAVRLHHNETVPAGSGAGERHMSINIDIAALLTDDGFRRRVVEELGKGPAPDHIVIPDHQAAEALAAVAGEAFPGLEVARIHRVKGSRLDATLRQELIEADRVLLLDDSVVRGNTLISLRRSVYDPAGDHNPVVEAFVVLDRPPSDFAERGVKRSFGAKKGGEGELGTGFRYVERVLLPDPDECPWCEERQKLTRLTRRVPEQGELIRERVDLLSSMEGLEPPLLPTREDQPGNVTHDAFVGNLKPAAAFAATASVAQNMRLDAERQRKGAQVAIVDVPVLVEAFYDPVVVAGLLRVIPKRFLRHHGYDAAVDYCLEQHVGAFGENCLAEIAWAAILGKVPLETIYAAIANLDERSDALETYRALIEVQAPSLRDHPSGEPEDRQPKQATD